MQRCMAEYNRMPLSSHTPSQRQRRVDLEHKMEQTEKMLSLFELKGCALHPRCCSYGSSVCAHACRRRTDTCWCLLLTRCACALQSLCAWMGRSSAQKCEKAAVQNSFLSQPLLAGSSCVPQSAATHLLCAKSICVSSSAVLRLPQNACPEIRSAPLRLWHRMSINQLATRFFLDFPESSHDEARAQGLTIVVCMQGQAGDGASGLEISS